MNELKKIVSEISDRTKWIEKQILEIRRILTEQPRGQPQTLNLKFDFPIDSSETLKLFLADINDNDYREKLKYRCKQEGGSNINKLVRNMWSFLFSVKIQRQFSWSGQHNKIKIMGSPLFSMICGKSSIKVLC